MRRPSRSGSTRWPSLPGGAAAVAELVARGVVEGSFDPKTLYRDRDDLRTVPPEIDELTLIASDADAASSSRPPSGA